MACLTSVWIQVSPRCMAPLRTRRGRRVYSTELDLGPEDGPALRVHLVKRTEAQATEVLPWPRRTSEVVIRSESKRRPQQQLH
eukprot:553760-Amphidinium_carterae.1